MIWPNNSACICLLTILLVVVNVSGFAVCAEHSEKLGAKLIHPILGVFESSQINQEKLDASVFLKLNGIYNTSPTIDVYTEDMLHAEVKACGALNRIVQGHTQGEVKWLIGRPDLITGPVKGLPDSAQAQENWFYNMGYGLNVYHSVKTLV